MGVNHCRISLRESPSFRGAKGDKRGMTVLELLLALALSAIVLYLLGVAIDMQWRLFDTRRSRVEETLLARSVLRRISDDIRSAVLYAPPDLEGLNAVADNPLTQVAGMAAGLTGGTQTGQPTQSGNSAPSAAAQPEGATEEPAANSTPKQTIVGLYGTSNWLAIDVSRLPRIDEYEAVLSAESGMTPLDIPSDVKTINYYIAVDETDGDTPTTEPGVLRGLVRQQLSRAVSSFNSEGGGSDDVTGAQVLAEEVTGVEFAYFDGTDWLSDWSSSEYGGLPLAVAIAIQIEMKASRVQSLTAATQGADVDKVKTASIHRLIVHLPAARKLPPVELTEQSSESSESTEQTAGQQVTTSGGQP